MSFTAHNWRYNEKRKYYNTYIFAVTVLDAITTKSSSYGKLIPIVTVNFMYICIFETYYISDSY